MKSKKNNYTSLESNYVPHQRIKRSYSLKELMCKKHIVDVQIHNHIIVMLSKKNKQLFVSAKLYVFEWEWEYLTRKNILDSLEPNKPGRPYWYVSEYKRGAYIASLIHWLDEDNTPKESGYL